MTKEKLIVYNTTDAPIFIVSKWKRDELGGPAKHETTFCVAPGEGLDLSMIGLSLQKLEDK